MEIIKTDVDTVNSTIKIKLSSEDYSKEVTNKLKENRSKASIPGFRPGKVPLSVIKKRIGNYLLSVEIEKILGESLYKYINENKLQLLGEPLPIENGKLDFDINQEKEYNFNFEIGLSPQFNVNLSPKDKFNYYKIIVDEKLINEEIEKATKRFGTIIEVEISKEEDILHGEFIELDKEEGLKTHIDLPIKMVENEILRKSLIGKKQGDSLIITPHDIVQDDMHLSKLFRIAEDQVKSISTKCQLTIERVKQLIPTKVDKALFDKVYKIGEINTEEEFRKKIKEEFTTTFEADSNWKLQFDIKEELMENLVVTLPDEFLKKWLLLTNEEKLSKEDIDKEYEGFSMSLKWQLIEEQIAKENNIKVTEEEAIDKMQDIFKDLYSSYGMPLPDDASLKEIARKELTDRKRAQEFYGNIMATKMMELYKNTFKLKTQEVSVEKFTKIIKENKKKSIFNFKSLKKYVQSK